MPAFTLCTPYWRKTTIIIINNKNVSYCMSLCVCVCISVCLSACLFVCMLLYVSMSFCCVDCLSEGIMYMFIFHFRCVCVCVYTKLFVIKSNYISRLLFILTKPVTNIYIVIQIDSLHIYTYLLENLVFIASSSWSTGGNNCSIYSVVRIAFM